MADNPAITPDAHLPKPIPFVGWSQAAANFRQRAAKFAPGGKLRVLLLGPTGVGKKTMARVWQKLAGSPTLPIVPLDAGRATLPNHCIAISTRPLSRNTKCWHLGSGDYQFYPKGYTDAETIPDERANQFPRQLRLFMPPLRERPADILALLLFFNRYVLRARIRGSYESISQQLLDVMLTNPWPANAQEVLKFLDDSARLDVRRIIKPKESPAINLGNLRASLNQDIFPLWNEFNTQPRRQKKIMSKVLEAIDRGDLPDTMYWRKYEKMGVSNSGKITRWAMLSDEPVIIFSELAEIAVRSYYEKCLPLLAPPLLSRDKAVPSAGAFRQLTIEQFVESGMRGIDVLKAEGLRQQRIDKILELCELSMKEMDPFAPFGDMQKMDLYSGARVSPSAVDVARGCEFVKRKVIFGTTFTALQDGLAINLDEAASIIIPRLANDKSRSRKWEPYGVVAIPRDNGKPIFFEKRHLIGEKEQITAALKKAGVLPQKASVGTLNTLVWYEKTLCGRQEGNLFHVYLSRSLGKDKLKKALTELERIKSDCFKPGDHSPPWELFKKFRKEPIEARSKEPLIKALHEFGILKTDTEDELFNVVQDGGYLFATSVENNKGVTVSYKIYLSDQCVEEHVKNFRSGEPHTASAEETEPDQAGFSLLKKVKAKVAEIEASSSSTSERS